jgi:glycolate oxidase FAD binding subunit
MMQPKSEAELAEAIRDAKGTLKIRGGGTRPIGNPVSGEVLSTSKLTGITLYEPGALTLVAKAGTPLAEIDAALAAENQRLPFEPMDHRALLGTDGVPTIGGIVAANVSGPRRIQAGACRDSLIGVRFVDGTGTALKNGGRVMKNVTGYDLVKLMAGAYGTLGVISEVSFKLLPATDASATVMINKQTPAQAVASMLKALGSPYEVSGAAYSPCGLDGTPITALRLEGFEASVKYRAEQLKDLLAGEREIMVETDPEKVKAGWAMIRDCHTLKNEPGDIWRVSAKPSDAPAFLEALGDAKYLLDWGGGLLWIACEPGTDLRAISPEIAGHRTLIRADDTTKKAVGVFHPEPAPLQVISAGLRAKFDPSGILNTGLMG